jgi:hypothetical protein
MYGPERLAPDVGVGVGVGGGEGGANQQRKSSEPTPRGAGGHAPVALAGCWAVCLAIHRALLIDIGLVSWSYGRCVGAFHSSSTKQKSRQSGPSFFLDTPWRFGPLVRLPLLAPAC